MNSNLLIMDLIPGLPNDLALDCLIRVPLESLPSAIWVCKAWNEEIRNPKFHIRFIQSGHTRPVFILANSERQKRYLDNNNQGGLFFSLTLFDPESRSFTNLRPSPSFESFEFSSFDTARIVSVGLNVIFIFITLHRPNFRYINVVCVFDLLTGQWRRGADIPGPVRSSFGLAADHARRQVLVAGGLDTGNPNNKLIRSALMYDVATDKWTQIADMAKERFECSAVLCDEMFHVISGRSSLAQSQPFNRMTCAESLDPDTLKWGPINDEFIEASASNRHWVMGNGEGDLYQVGENAIVRRRRSEEKWQEITKIPDELNDNVECVMTWRDKMVVIEGRTYNRSPKAFVLDLKSCEWTKQDLPDESLLIGCSIDLYVDGGNRFN